MALCFLHLEGNVKSNSNANYDPKTYTLNPTPYTLNSNANYDPKP